MPTSSKAQTPKAQAQARRQRLLAMLAEGSFYSGEQLAKKLKISRAGVWKLMNSLKALGVDIESVARQGYRLPRAVDLLDKEAIVTSLPAATRSHLERADVLLTVDSTNRFVADLSPPQAGYFQLCTTEVQNAGRGRRGRSWVAPFGSGVCMSLGWQFAEAPPTFSALSLAVGVAVVKAFRRLGIEGVGLKWPNDLVWQQRKLGGILIEMRGESAGPAQVVIGLGLNVRMPATVRLLQDLARASSRRAQPMAALFFGSPYVAASVPEVPAMLLAYDFSDLAEASAVRALAGEIPIRGRLPIAIPGMFSSGQGLTR